jgi:co-chaperonin GroES (HSP10)
MNIKPLADRVVIKSLESEEVTKGGEKRRQGDLFKVRRD